MSDSNKFTTPVPLTEGTGPPLQGFAVFFKDGTLTIRLPLSLLRFVWAGLGVAGWMT